MRPLDPRLLRYASATRGTLAAGAVLTALQTASIIAFAWLVTDVVVRAIAGETLGALSGTLVLLGAVVAERAALFWAIEAVASRGGARVVGQLRARLV